MGLSVVVACHNVGEFLPACLDSLLAQDRPADQVVLVNDGSSDDTAEICARYAAAHPGWLVVDGPGSGPGGARDLGLAHVDQEYLAFVDGDDVVPSDGFRILLTTLEKTGSDFACGDVLRYDGAHLTPSGPHRNAILSTKLRTTIRATPSLIYDTTSWNKIFRTTFWREAGLVFPSGVTYEDIPVMIAAHVQARSVDVLKAPVYWWRRRIDAHHSITQRRYELDNLRDRMDAIDAVNVMVADDPYLKRIHDRKVLTFDIPLYTAFFADADEMWQQTFLDRVGAFVKASLPEVMAELPPRDRVRYFLIEHGRRSELVEFLEFERDPYALRQTIPGDGVTYAALPFFGEPGYPEELYIWGKAQPVVSEVESVAWTADGLAVSGYAYLQGIDSGDAQQRRLSIRLLGGDEPQTIPVKWQHRDDLTAKELDADVTYSNVGFSFVMPLTAIADEGHYRFDVFVAAPGGKRRVPLTGAYDGAAHLPRRLALPDGGVAAVRWRGDTLGVARYRPPALVTGMTAPTPDVIRVAFDQTVPGATVIARRRDDFEQVEVPMAGSVDLDISGLPHLEVLGQIEFDVLLQIDGTAEPAILAPELDESLSEPGDQESYARAGVSGGLVVTLRPPRPRLRGWRFTRNGLELSGDHARGMTSLVLMNRNEVRHEYPVAVSGDQWSVTLPARDTGTLTGICHLPVGRWSLLTDDDAPFHVAQSVRERMTRVQWDEIEGVRFGMRARRSATAALQVDPSGSVRPPGLHGRREIVTTYYPKRRSKRLRKVILFENWKGKQYSDNLRAIHEELQRRRDRRKRIWVVRDHGVRMPSGVQTVLRFSPEYYDLLARSRWIVANDSIDPSYVKRDDGQTYLQTWHGTPLKKVGQDIEKVNFARKGYLESFANESAKWSYLVSPNEYSSQIMSRSFGIPAERILPTGYPRNDIFYRPERDARAAATRQRLGLAPDQKVILYAPTWRDDRYDDRGRYIFELKLNVDAMREQFGGSHVLLLRGHHLLATRAGMPAGDGFVKNVSTYPDIADLYLIADVLITDYSSVMFDFVNTGRPMLFYTWDLDDYRDRVRGLYFDLTEDPPGPICRTSADVFAALADLPDVAEQYQGAYGRFRDRFCAWEDGYAAARVIDAALR